VSVQRLDNGAIVVGLDGVQSEIAMMRTPDGYRVMFAVDDIDDTVSRRGHGAELLGEVAQ
jgi:hypothetical protein